MSLHTIDLTAKLSNAEMAAICAESNTKDPRKAVARFFKQAVNAAAVRAAYPRPHRPNSATARALRSKKRGGVVLRDRADVDKFIASIPTRP